MGNKTRFNLKRNETVKLIKKEYYINEIDNNKTNPAKTWKTLKKLVRGDNTKDFTIKDIDFEILGNFYGRLAVVLI